MNWDNQNNNKDPWGRNNNDGPDFDDLIKRFSMILVIKAHQMVEAPQVEYHLSH